MYYVQQCGLAHPRIQHTCRSRSISVQKMIKVAIPHFRLKFSKKKRFSLPGNFFQMLYDSAEENIRHQGVGLSGFFFIGIPLLVRFLKLLLSINSRGISKNIKDKSFSIILKVLSMYFQNPEGSVVNEVLKGSSSHKVVNYAKTSKCSPLTGVM